MTREHTGAAVAIDGLLTEKLDANGLCTVFREWWQSTEEE